MADVPSANKVIADVVRYRIEAGLRAQLERVVPVDTGALRRSLRFEVRQRRDAVIVRLHFLGYGRVVDARNSDANLVAAMSAIMRAQLSEAVAEAGIIFLRLLLNAWTLSIQNAFATNVSRLVPFEVRFTRIPIRPGQLGGRRR